MTEPTVYLDPDYQLSDLVLFKLKRSTLKVNHPAIFFLKLLLIPTCMLVILILGIANLYYFSDDFMYRSAEIAEVVVTHCGEQPDRNLPIIGFQFISSPRFQRTGVLAWGNCDEYPVGSSFLIEYYELSSFSWRRLDDPWKGFFRFLLAVFILLNIVTAVLIHHLNKQYLAWRKWRHLNRHGQQRPGQIERFEPPYLYYRFRNHADVMVNERMRIDKRVPQQERLLPGKPIIVLYADVHNHVVL